ncbi:hypothetical protein KJN74_02375 [Candidatus Bathyarchaeota archaeon]|nr:hypothetical protein [Candidatus Bathyarchaeota archaeon]
MSAVSIALREFRELEPEDLYLIQAIEKQMKNYKYAPKTAIQKQAQLPVSEIEYRLPILIKKRLLKGWRGKYLGYSLTTAGHDILAINAFVKDDVIKAFGKQIGVGKESDIYEALNPDEKQVVLKFHRIGRTSFKKTKLKRNYALKYNYTPDWYIQSKISAKKEYQALKLLHSKNLAVPEPIKQNRHVLVMGMIEGTELFRFHELPNVKAVYNEILYNVKRIYREIKMIHGDLSPYNIILQPNQHIVIFDWPQNISITNPNAKKILERDIQNILTFFKRKYGLNNQLEDVMKYINSKSETKS